MFNFMGRLGGFSNLAGIGRRTARPAKAAKAEESDDGDDSPKRNPEESDEDYAKRCGSYADEHDDEELKRKDGESDGDYAKRMDAIHGEPDGDEDEDGDEPEDEENPDKDEDAKKANKKSEARGFKRGFAAANARGAKIFGSAEAGDNPQLAAQLAFNTDLTADAALSVMKAAVTAGGGKLASRMARTQQPRVGSGGSAERSSAEAIQHSWTEALAPFAPKK